ncbi:CBO0543 family protein [Heyndrickxia sp. MSNUG]|uniref:CBO0543 family protein n=1 Tax=Heyndrickxia sp. MSNUG TaxID=3136677 RepID=UPI003C2DA7AD
MGRNHEKNILWALFIFGIFSFFQLVKKPPLKDWLMIFLLKGYIASILDNLLVKKGYLKYPVSLFKTFDISVLFSYILFPVTCIYFNQVTKNNGLIAIFLKSILFSLPSAIAEHWIEKKTDLIKYKKSWTSIHSFTSIASTFLAVRFLMGGIRKWTQKEEMN